MVAQDVALLGSCSQLVCINRANDDTDHLQSTQHLHYVSV